MKRLTVCLLSCVILAGSGWLAHIVWAQPAAEPAKEKTFTITQSQLDKFVADQVAKAMAEHEKGGAAAGAPVSDEQVLKSQNWHRAVFNKAEYVVYTGPGQAMFHHWIPQASTPSPKGGATAPSTPPSK